MGNREQAERHGYDGAVLVNRSQRACAGFAVRIRRHLGPVLLAAASAFSLSAASEAQAGSFPAWSYRGNSGLQTSWFADEAAACMDAGAKAAQAQGRGSTGYGGTLNDNISGEVRCRVTNLSTGNQGYGDMVMAARCDPAIDSLGRAYNRWQLATFCWTPAPPPPTCPSADQSASDHLACIKPLTYERASCPVGNPIYPGRGNKVQSEIRYAAAVATDLSLVDTYRSDWATSPRAGLGTRWTHNWARALDIAAAGSAAPVVVAMRADGSPVPFYRDTTTGAWTVAQNISVDRLEALAPGDPSGARWRYTDAASDAQEQYDDQGRLLSVRERNGWTTTLSYSTATTPGNLAPRAGLLLQVRNQFGRVLNFSYDASARVATVSGSGGLIATYSYNASSLPERVTWADGKSRQYHYENSTVPGGLTGITDEAGVRFATYTYDIQGRATSSEHAGGVNKVLLQFLGDNQTTVTTADGSSRTYTFESQGNVIRPASVSAPCPECGNVAKTTAYDGSGNVSSRVDFDNQETRYSYDALGRETQRIEGYGTVDAKTTTIEWHPTWNLPVRVTRPGQINNFSYGTAGQLLSYAWYTSDDPSGSKGFQAVPTGAESSTIWIYNSQGLVEKVTDTLNGVAMGEWTFSYDSAGQLLSLANDYGRVGNVVSRDAGGRITEAVNTDGQHLRLQYDAMGRLTSRDVDGVVTTYTYNEIGLLTVVQGATNVIFEYDAAHRLTAYLLPEGQTMKVSDISNPFVLASSLSSGRTAAVPQESFWSRVWSTIKHWLGSLIGNANAQSGWTRWQVSPVGPSQSRSMPSSSSDADILEQGTGSRQWPDPGIILATWTTQVIEKGVQAAKEAICGSSEPCPPCRTVTGKIIALGTIGHRPLDTPPPGKPQHGIDGPHYNLFKANQAPRNSPKACWCFWQPIGAVRPEDLPANAIPVEHFSN